MSKSKLLALVVASSSILILVSCKNDQGVGKTCDLGDSADSPSRTAINSNASECQTGVCLKVALDPSKASVDPPTGATCSAECSSDSDCDGELRDSANPADTRCKSGFACGVPFVVGPYCCKRYCMCRDFLGSAGATTPAACQGPDARTTCQGSADNGVTPVPVQETNIYLNVAPQRKVDLVFMIDNSPSMAPKVTKLNQQFPRLIEALKDPSDGTYPDLRIAMIDSDLGTGGAYQSGSCGPNESNGENAYGDVGNFQMGGAAGCGVASGSLWLETAGGRPLNFATTTDISQVFGCLAGNLGTTGCGEEHQLQAFEFALVAQNLHRDQHIAQNAFLRPEAYLGLVFLSDEDDCSAATNDGMFGDKVELRGESASLRCATRGHKCNGTNLSDAGPGYPTTVAYQTGFASCAARTDSCPNTTDSDGVPTDTSGPTSCSPLKSIYALAQELKQLKVNPEEQVLVAGIFGWPRMLVDAAGQPVLDSAGRVQADMANAEYKIDSIPNPNVADTTHPQIWDYWPVCYDPDHQPAIPGTFDANAWGWGAQGGLRMSAFIDSFGANGLKYSICERDYSQAMSGIGNAIAKKLRNMCIDSKLKDADPVAPGLQPDCRVAYRTPQVDPATNRISYVESPQSLPVCAPGTTPDTATSDCWQLVSDLTQCPDSGQLVSIVRPAAAGALAVGTKIAMQCSTCPALVSIAGCE
jgi:hypothetical protein